MRLGAPPPLQVSGRATVAAAVFTGIVSAESDVYVSGRIRSAVGNVPITQSVTVNAQTATAGTLEVAIPTDAHITNITFQLVDDVFATAASDINILIGTSGDDNQYATIAASGGVPSIMQIGNVNFTGVSGAALHGKAAGGIFIKTTAAASGAVTSKNALLTFTYIRTA